MRTITPYILALLMTCFMLPAQADPVSNAWGQFLSQSHRCLDLYRPSSQESAYFCYWKPGTGYQKQGYLKAVHMLRDVQYKKTHNIDPQLLDILFLVQSWLKEEGRASRIHILSGYRTPEHNFRLEGAAKQSLHVQGKAADIHIPGLDTRLLAMMSRYLGAGGVGVYVDRNFIHIDTGRIRQWRG